MTAEDQKPTNGPAVRVERQAHVLVATINRPEAMNSVNADVTRQLGDAVQEAEENPDVWCLIVTGAGEKAFCAGADLKALSRGEDISVPGREAWGFAGYVNHPISKPTIAAVNGFALGGGTEISLASDLVVASRSASFGLPEVARGVLAAAGGLIRLPRQIPRKVAMHAILTAEAIDAETAMQWGLVNVVVDPEKVLDEALVLADKICRNAPLAVQASKRIALGMVDGRLPDEDAAWEINTREIAKIMQTNDFREGPRAFAEKRAPRWTAS